MGWHTITGRNKFHDLAFLARQLTKPSRTLMTSGCRWFDLGKWVCFPLFVVSTVGRECFSLRLGFRGGYWFVVIRLVVLSPCSFYL